MFFFPIQIQDSRKNCAPSKGYSYLYPQRWSTLSIFWMMSFISLFENCDFQQNMNVDLNFEPNEEGQDILQA